MFTKIKEVKIVDETRIKELELKISQLKEEHQRELKNIKDDNQREITNIKADFESAKKITDNEISVKIQEAVREKELEISKLREQNGIQAKEISVLTRAFENMGFDVKDMKDILNKLVDGVVSKNTVNIVK